MNELKLVMDNYKLAAKIGLNTKEMTAEILQKQESYLQARQLAKKLDRTEHHPEQPKITSDRPIPAEARGGQRHWTHFYPFEEMKVGDSFWVPEGQRCTAGAVSKFAKRSGWRFVSRAELEDGTPAGKGSSRKRGTRVWRTG